MRYIAEAPGEVTKRDLARAFRLKGQDRANLRHMMGELHADGLLVRGHKRRVRPIGRLPSVAVLDIAAIDEDGELIARLATPEGAQEPAANGAARILLIDRGQGRAPKIGDRILAKLGHVEDGSYEARLIKILPRPAARLVGVLERSGRGLVVRPLDRNGGREVPIDPADAEGAAPGDLVAIERRPDRPLGAGSAKVIERLGHVDDHGASSMLAAYHHDLPTGFPEEVLALAESAEPVELGKRRDLRNLPLVTIDGADARDFDDAVFAKADDDPENPGGFRITVAIADVSHYVRPGDPLDVEAQKRGNSVYFPDRVLPMLPEPLSNGLCSLRPDEDRACLAVHIWLDENGKKRGHRFERALMRSRARLTYEQIQAARDGNPAPALQPLVKDVIAPLYGAYDALLTARRRRGTLDLDIPELQVILDEASRPVEIAARPRLDSHRLIEEFMIIANVAAAETLEKASLPCMYRVHDKPDNGKLEALGQLLSSLGIVKQSQLGAKPKDLARLLEKTREHPMSPLISTLLLRAQSQAVYSPTNLGHYGLNLGRYAHFTSPIRRYADLLVHRALIRALKLGDGGLPEEVDNDAMHELGGHISGRERRAMEAERSAKDRFVAMFMADRVGGSFEARITSVHRFGLFVQMKETMAEALVPISSLSANRLDHDMAGHALVDRQRGDAWTLGDEVTVKLVEVDTLTGRLAARLTDHRPGPAARPPSKAKSKPSRPPIKRGRRR